MTLNSETRALFEQAKAKAPPPVIAKLLAIFDRLEAAHLGSNATKVGDKAPAGQFLDSAGKLVSLASLYAERPIVLMSFRGRWCPFCDLTLKAFNAIQGDINAAGAHLIAVSPQTVEQTALTKSERGLAFDVMSDPHNAAAEAFGLAWSLTEEERGLYKAFNSNLDQANGDDRWALPAPAAFVIDQQGIVRWAYVDPNHTRRPEPADVLAAVRALNAWSRWPGPSRHKLL